MHYSYQKHSNLKYEVNNISILYIAIYHSKKMLRMGLHYNGGIITQLKVAIIVISTLQQE
jgi:hypothetical protein